MNPGKALARKRWNRPRALPDPKTLGERVKSTRLALKWTQAQLATKLGVSVSLVKQWETDRARPWDGRLDEAAKVLGASARWLENGD